MSNIHPIKYPEVLVSLVDQDGNAMLILARVRRALRRADAPASDIEQYTIEVTAGDYDHLLQTTMKWVNVE
jgi:hypothetical protein